MPNPTRSDVHVNSPLTQVSIAYLQDQAKYVSTQCFPTDLCPKTVRSILHVFAK